ncbi:MAG: hypothetical protein NC453_11520 [Muribaculum sp.]|nr:hypothetical protein [Muribaculum sp.]
MTYEEFEQLALNPPRPDGETVFVVTEIDMCDLPERRKRHYPKFKVFRHIIGYGKTLEDAEELMRKAIEQTGEVDDFYCFHINEHLLGVYNHWSDYGISWWLYGPTGKLIDHSWCDSRHYAEAPFTKFRGRPKSSIRFKAGDIVEVLDGDEVRLAVATQSPADIEWCWGLRNRIAERLEKDGPVTDEMIEIEYILDGSDDQAAVIDGPGYEYHDHIPTQNIMPLRTKLFPHQRKRYEDYWKACLKQDEGFEKQRETTD